MTQIGWDSVRVEVDFCWDLAVGKEKSFPPDTLSITIFDQAYRTLYAGSERIIPVPDWTLGDRERLLVEVCGFVRDSQMCMQENITASPKRIDVDLAIEYPDNNDYTRGEYEFTFNVERRRFMTDAWEQSEEHRDVRGHLLSWVEEDQQEMVKVPFTRQNGVFNLARQDNYKDFRYNLESQLYDKKEALVHFEIYAGLNGQVDKVASVDKLIQLKTQVERAMEVYFFAEQVSEFLIDTLDSLPRSRRAVVYVDDWEYNESSRIYSIQLELNWRTSFFSQRAYQISGILRVSEDGSSASFMRNSANSEMRRRWRSQVDSDIMEIGSLVTLQKRDVYYRRLPRLDW